jgi:hypothetical protein
MVTVATDGWPMPLVIAYTITNGSPVRPGAVASIGPVGLTSPTSSGSDGLRSASGRIVTVSPGVRTSLASTSRYTRAPGAAVIWSSTATGGCGEPGGVTPMRTPAWPTAPYRSCTT